MMPVVRTSALIGAALACLLATGCSVTAGSNSSGLTSSPSLPPATARVTPATARGGTETPTPGSDNPPGQRFSVVATADVLLHPALWAQARRDAGGAGMGWVFAGHMIGAGIAAEVAG
jgi:hypothetical protein